jgi:hypothetical protein
MELNINKSKTMHITKGIQRRLTIVWGGGRGLKGWKSGED